MKTNEIRTITPRGWEYASFANGFYNFVRRDISGGVYAVKRCNESDLTADKLAVMVQSGASR